MNTLLSRFMALFIISLIAKPSLVHLKPVQSDSDNTANASTTTLSANPPRQNLSLPRYTAMVDNLVGALQIIHSLLTQHVSVIFIITDHYNIITNDCSGTIRAIRILLCPEYC